MWVDEICRLCAQVSEVLLPIFERNGDRARLDLKIKKCLSISITENDQKPKHICYSCCNKLEDMNDFIEICHSADFKFESILFAASTQQHSEQQTVINERKWPNEKITEITQEIPQESQMTVQHDGVIVVGKVDETQNINRECQDILLMVELKYKDVEIDPQSAELMKQNKIIYQGNEIIQEKQIVFPQGVLRHSDDFTKIQDKQQDININTIEYTETQQSYIEQPIEVIKTNSYVIQENKTRSKTKPFPCSHCNKSFMRRSNLNAHMSSHTLVKPYQCDQCDRTFAVRWNLTVHQRIHSGLFSCDVCGKAFPVKGKLDRHRRTHTGEKPFVCTLPGCSKAFADKRNLEAHNRIHTQEKPHVCNVCSRAFGSKSHMIDHQKVHSKEAPFTCDLCGKSFKWKTNLTIHLRSHSGEKCICVDCGKQFVRKSQLNKHRKIFHPELLRKKNDILEININ